MMSKNEVKRLLSVLHDICKQGSDCVICYYCKYYDRENVDNCKQDFELKEGETGR